MSSSSDDDILVVEGRPVKSAIKLQRIPPIDPSVLTDLEKQARQSAKSLHRTMKYLIEELADISNVSEMTIEVYDGAVQHTQQDVEKSIRLMYGMIAKCEEMDEKMQPVHHIAEKVANIKLMLDDLEKCI